MPTLLAYDDLKPRKGIRLARTQLWRLMKDGKFPRSVHVSANRVAWLETDIDSYLAERVKERVPA